MLARELNSERKGATKRLSQAFRRSTFRTARSFHADRQSGTLGAVLDPTPYVVSKIPNPEFINDYKYFSEEGDHGLIDTPFGWKTYQLSNSPDDTTRTYSGITCAAGEWIVVIWMLHYERGVYDWEYLAWSHSVPSPLPLITHRILAPTVGTVRFNTVQRPPGTEWVFVMRAANMSAGFGPGDVYIHIRPNYKPTSLPYSPQTNCRVCGPVVYFLNMKEDYNKWPVITPFFPHGDDHRKGAGSPISGNVVPAFVGEEWLDIINAHKDSAVSKGSIILVTIRVTGQGQLLKTNMKESARLSRTFNKLGTAGKLFQ